MAYGLSAPLYQWIGNADLRRTKMRGLEDVRTAQYLLSLNRTRGEQLIRLNFDGRMGDWKYWDGREWTFNPNTVLAIHNMKQEEALKHVRSRLNQDPV